MMRGAVVEPDGRPVVGRLVSNGVESVVTGPDGSWQLSDVGQPFVWVHRGGGFDCDDWYRPIGDEPLVFRLHPSNRTRTRFAHVTDLHVDVSTGVFDLRQGDCTAERLRAVFSELADGFGCDFVLATGDLTNRGTLDDLAEFRAALIDSPVPVFFMPGNHDHYGGYFETADPVPDPVTAEPSSRPSGWRYEAQLGPRWWSMSEAGLRIVAIDWHSWHLDEDADVQRVWLASDLRHAPAGTAVLILSHDLMSRDFYEYLAEVAPHVRIVGSLSGHWHTARSGRIDGELHLNTGNPMFGSWDWSPPHARVLEFDGSRLSVRTRALAVEPEHRSATFVSAPVADGAVPTDRVRWRSALDGVAHLGGPVVAESDRGRLVVAGWRDEDHSNGGVSAISTADGAVLWSARLDGAVVGRVDVTGGDVTAVTIDGRVAMFDLATGAQRWSRRLDSSRGLWVCSKPLVAGGAVVVGSGPLLAGLDRRDGRELWRRTDIGSHEMYPNYGDGLVADRNVILGMPSIEPSIHAVDAATGETAWTLTATTGGGSPAGSLTYGSDRRAYGLSHRPELFCIDASTGEELFRVDVGGRYTWAAPLVIDATVLVMSADAWLFGFDAMDGSELWRVQVPAAAAPGFAPYRGPGQSSITSPVRACEGGEVQSFVASTDGSVWSISPATGVVDRLVRLPAAVTAGIAVSGDSLIVPTADGSLWCVDATSR